MLKKWKQMKSKKPILRLAAGAVALSGLLATPSFAETPKSTSYKIIKSTKVSNAVPSIDKEAEMVKLYVQNAWNARMFQLYDKIPIGKSVDDEIKSVPLYTYRR